jgi:hypothetical protein
MQGWLDLEYIRAHCKMLRAEAARMRLARDPQRAARDAARERIARTLFVVGKLFVAAGNRVRGNATVAN